jgi:choline dehydrogenase-like flavoprotein
MCDEHTRWDETDYGFWLECPPFLPALGSVAMPGFGQAHASLLRDFRRLGSVIALTRDGADTEVSSGAVRARRDGSVSIRYALTPADARRVRASIAAAARLQLAAGATEVRTLHTTPITVRREADLAAIASAPVGANRVGLFSAHVNGTCRMGASSARAATDPEGQLYGVRGVVVCDGSLLPTAPGVNPQETIMALATVVAERLALRHGPLVSTSGELSS